MYFEVVKKIYATHGTKTLIAYLIRDVNDAKYLAIIRHGKIQGYVPLEAINEKKI